MSNEIVLRQLAQLLAQSQGNVPAPQQQGFFGMPQQGSLFGQQDPGMYAGPITDERQIMREEYNPDGTVKARVMEVYRWHGEKKWHQR
jgi:hypothetical protein